MKEAFMKESNGENLEEPTRQTTVNGSRAYTPSKFSIALQPPCHGSASEPVSNSNPNPKLVSCGMFCGLGKPPSTCYRWICAHNMERPRHRHNWYGGQRSVYGHDEINRV
ncbi:unnamed protein product [Amaranthus hypochondriacus]